MSKEKPTLLEKAITFILDSFTDEKGQFACPFGVEECLDVLCEGCDNCKVKQGFNEIMGVTT